MRFSLNRMNGTSFWAFSLWRAPEDAEVFFAYFSTDTVPSSYTLRELDLAR